MKTAYLTVLSWLIAASPSFAQSVASEIEKVNMRFEQAFNRGDAAAVAQMYTENATVLPPDSDMMTGHDSIQTFWQGAHESGIKNLSLKSIRVDELGGDAAKEIVRFSLEAPGARGQMNKVDGKYVVVWRKAGSDWKIETDIWNTNKPAAPETATGGTTAPTTGAGSAQ